MDNKGTIKFEVATVRQYNALVRFAQRIHLPFVVGKSTDKTLGEVINKAEADFAAGRGRRFTLEELDAFVDAIH